MPEQFKAHAALILVSFVYGGNYSIAKIAMDANLPPLAFILLRVIAGLILFWVFHTLFVREKVERKDFGRIFLCAVFGIALTQMLAFTGLHYTTPINAALITTTVPILVLVISALMLGEAITGRKILGIFLGAAGAIALIAYGKDIQFARNQTFGNILVVCNSTAFAIYLVLVKTLMRKYHPFTVIKWMFTFGIVLVLPFGLREFQTTAWETFTPEVWLAIGYVLVGTTFLAYLLNAFALKTVNASVVSIYVYLQPMIAAVIAILLGKDDLDWVKIIAGLCIFAGVYFVSTKVKKVTKVRVKS